jgi:hypothetical protein
LDEFLLPVLHRLYEGEFGDPYVVGINLDAHRLVLTGLDRLLQEHTALFLAYDKDGNAILLGAPSPLHRKAFTYAARTAHQTALQLSIQLDLPTDEAEEILDYFAARRVVTKLHSDVHSTTYFDTLFAYDAPPKQVGRCIGEELTDRIRAARAIEQPAHY